MGDGSARIPLSSGRLHDQTTITEVIPRKSSMKYCLVALLERKRLTRPHAMLRRKRLTRPHAMLRRLQAS